jgi:glycine dehydrogenase subunit 1
MRADIGVESVDDLFEAIPEPYRFPNLEIPAALSEMEAAQLLSSLAAGNVPADSVSFLGAGAYHHYTPAAINQLLLRGEIYTAYTPYQPEVSQGTLQAIYEYQSVMSALTGMEVSNASHYDGATAVAESILMAVAASRGRRKRIVMSPAIHPQYRAVARTYIGGREIEIAGDDDLARRAEDLPALLDDQTAALIVGYPDFFGTLTDLAPLAEAAHDSGALLVVVANPMALGLVKPPGRFGVDIVCGEGQPLGLPLSFGGPYLGYFCTREKYVRSMSGRLVGETVDENGVRGYVLTLATREQHIRRERATSNICTNQGLMSIAAAMYLAIMGKNGLRKIARLNYDRAHYAAAQIDALDGFRVVDDGPFFNEFAVEAPLPAAELNAHLAERGITGGYDLSRDYAHRQNQTLLCVTEMNARADIDRLIGALKEVAS